MTKLLNASFAYLLAGVAAGLFYREFTKQRGFPEGRAVVGRAVTSPEPVAV